MKNKIYLLSSMLIFNNIVNAATINKNRENISINLKLIKNKKFESKFFYPWNINFYLKKSEALWPFYIYPKKNVYKENLQKYSKNFFNILKKNANFNNFNKINKPAITLERVMLRNFPTNKPIFYNPNKPGEGFPFSYNDNSAVHPQEPLNISHFSKDRKFAYVSSSYASGWVEVKKIAYVSKNIINRIKSLKKIVLIKDNISILNDKKYSLFFSKVGMILPVLEEKPTYYKVLVVSRTDILVPKLEIVNIPKSISIPLKSEIDTKLIKKMSKQLLNNPYGWGGSNGDRDCSSTIKDLFATTGKWLPRNSKAIANYGKKTDISKMSRRKKEAFIINNAVPYKTVLYMKGHIMLYIGQENGIVKIFHDMWGIGYIKNGKYRKKIVGKTVETDLYLGKEYRKKRYLIDSLKSMSIF